MLTLPSDISNNKNKVAIKPILLIDFVDKGYYIASKDYTASGTVYSSLMERGNTVKIGTNLPENINGISSVTSPTLKLLSWRGTLRSGLVGSTPDLTDSMVDIYFKLDTASTNKADAVKIFSGKIATWEVERDILTLRLKSPFPQLPPVPAKTLKELDFKSRSNYSPPLQFGDFNWATHPHYYLSILNYALCPLQGVYRDDSTDPFSYRRYYIADRSMHTLPTNTDLAKDLLGNMETSGLDNAYAFVLRDGLYHQVNFYRNAGNTVNYIRQIVNSSNGSYIETFKGEDVRLWLPPTDVGTNNTATNPENSFDGNPTTYATIDSSHTYLEVINPDFRNILVESSPKLNANSKLNILVAVHLGTVTGNDHLLHFGDDPLPIERYFGSSDSNTVIVLDASANNDFTDISYLYTHGEVGIIRNPTGGTIQVKEIMVGVRMNDLTDSEPLYLRCKGRKYEDTWGGRKTSGNLIANVVDALESVFRYNWGITSALETASFDNVRLALENENISAQGTYPTQSTAKQFLEEFGEMFNLGIVFTHVGKWRLVLPWNDYNVFPDSGGNTPNNEDIFSDAPALSGDAYTQHMIQRESFRIGRSDANEIYKNVGVNYHLTHLGYKFQYLPTVSGNPVPKMVNAWIIGHSGSAESLRNILFNWISKQRMIAEFETSYSAIAYEVGDVINIRHGDLSDSLLEGTVNTQKWMIIEIDQKFRPNLIYIKAEELLSPGS